MKCEYDSTKTCTDCDEHVVLCDECDFISEEGDCDNSDSKNNLRFMDGLAVCCNLFKKKVQS